MVILLGSFSQLGWLEGFLLLGTAGAATTSLFLLNWAYKAVDAKESENGHGRDHGGDDDDGESDNDNNNDNNNNNDDEYYAAAAESLVHSNTTLSYGILEAEMLGTLGSNTLKLLTLVYCIGRVVAYLGAIDGQVNALLLSLLLPALAAAFAEHATNTKEPYGLRDFGELSAWYTSLPRSSWETASGHCGRVDRAPCWYS